MKQHSLGGRDRFRKQFLLQFVHVIRSLSGIIEDVETKVWVREEKVFRVSLRSLDLLQ